MWWICHPKRDAWWGDTDSQLMSLVGKVSLQAGICISILISLLGLITFPGSTTNSSCEASNLLLKMDNLFTKITMTLSDHKLKLLCISLWWFKIHVELGRFEGEP